MKITPKQRKEARINEGQKYIPLNIEGYELVIAWNTWSKLEKKINEIINK